MDLIKQWMDKVDSTVAAGPFAADWESLKGFKIPRWYEDAKFGIFIHWGVFSVPAFANEWYSRNMYQQKNREYEHHVKTYGPHTKFGYKDFVPMFKAERFDPRAWAGLFKEAGAKYVVPVAEHHDGFAMYDCSICRWNAVNMGPNRDMLGQLSQAVRDAGLISGLSSHRAEHWWFFDGGRQFDSDVQDPAYADFYGPAQPRIDGHGIEERTVGSPDEAYLRDWLARCCELVDKYRPRVIYFDWWIRNLAFEPYLKKFAAYYYNRGAQWNLPVAINGKMDAFPPGTVLFDIERGQLKDIRPIFWQCDTSISKISWCDVENNEYKTSTSIVQDLIDIVSKNGTMMLNVGPKSDGTIVEPEQKILRDIGRFLARAGEGIYGSRPWKIYGEGPTEVAEGAFTDTKRAEFTHQDIRFTTRGETLYAFSLGAPSDGRIVIRSLGRSAGKYDGEIGSVTLLGGGPLRFERDEAGLTAHLPSAAPFEHAIALKISRRQ
jgi:alpha-L-fucosidase